MTRLARAEARDGDDLLFIVGGERGAVIFRVRPSYCTFSVHSPVPLPLTESRRWGGLGHLDGHRCPALEGPCHNALVPCGSYDLDRPDCEDVIQWEALEEIYLRYLEGAFLWGS